MLDQPLIGEPNQSSKACWGCHTATPYNQGFCPTCWATIPATVQRLYCDVQAAEDLNATWRAQLRMAVASALKIQLQPKERVSGNWTDYFKRKKRAVTPLSLKDLGL